MKRDRAAMAAWLGKLPAGTPVAMEGAFGWQWVADWLTELALAPRLGHPSAIRVLAKNEAKANRVDADRLARFWLRGIFSGELPRDARGATSSRTVTALSGARAAADRSQEPHSSAVAPRRCVARPERACNCTPRSHAQGIPAYYDYPISTGPLEGTNDTINTMKRQAYGLRDQESLKLKICEIHEPKYAFFG